MDIEKEMLTSDGLGAAIKNELREVKKDKGFVIRDAKGQNLEEGDEVWMEGYSEQEGRGVIVSLREGEGYAFFTVHFHTDDCDEDYTAQVRWEDDSAYFAEEFELR